MTPMVMTLMQETARWGPAEVTGVAGALTVLLSLVLPWWSARQKAKHDGEVSDAEVGFKLREELRATVERQGEDIKALQEELGEVRSRSKRCEDERDALREELEALREELDRLRGDVARARVEDQARRRGMAS